MDIISSSTFSLPQNIDHTRSVLSLSKYEEKTFKSLKPQLLAVLLVSVNHMVIGIAFGYSAVLLPQLNDDEHLKQINEYQKSWIASSFVLIGPISSLFTGYIMEKIGRLNTLKLTTIPNFTGWLCIALAQNFYMLIIGRVLIGCANALGTNPAQVYISEISHKDLRGSFLSLGPMFVSIGIIMAYVKGWLIGWRLLAWFSGFFSIIPLILLFFIKESPIWLLSKNRIEDAKISLNWFYKYQPKISDLKQNFAELQLRLLQKDIENNNDDNNNKGGNWRAFLKPTAYKPLLIITGLFVFQQFSGIYILQFYTVTFFENIGTTINPYVASIGFGIIRLIMSIIGTWMLKQYTRRFLVIFSSIGMAIFMLISGIFTYLIKTQQTDLNWIPVVCLLLYVIFALIGLLPIPWIIAAELFAIEIRSVAYCILMGVANMTMFLAVQNYYGLETMFHGIAGVQCFFAAVTLMGVFYTILFLPETHQKKFAEIEQYFNEHTIYFSKKS